MTIDAILDINKAETEAEKIVSGSVENARALLADAKSQAGRIMDEAASGGRTAYEEKTLLAERRAGAEVDRIKRRIAAECEQIVKNARSKFTEATVIIAGRIIKTNVDR